MANAKEIIEKIWWVIPPVVVVFMFLPVFRWLDVGRCSFGEWIGIFQFLLGEITGIIVAISMAMFMGIGYYLIKRKSLLLRLIIPTLLAIIGFYIGFVIVFILACLSAVKIF
ncbi:MAG: hypothetical protein ACXQS5_06135 [Candidatus Methanospirareceae archaeon]